MRRISILIIAMVAVLLSSRPAAAKAFGEVGTCDAPLTSFSTISAAVAAAPPGSTILVCPGVYPEQVTINKPLTLLGEIDPKDDTDRPVIVAPPPSEGLLLNVISIFGDSFAAQVLVTAGPVNLKNITVDGTGAVVAGAGSCVAGIFYASGSSGVVDAVTTRNQTSNSCSTGIWAENGNPTGETVTIADSSVHDFDGTGIFVGSGPLPSGLAAIVKANGVGGTSVTGVVGIESEGAASLIANNVVTGGSIAGISIQFEGGEITNNTVAKSNLGIFVGAGASLTRNVLWKNGTGIELLAASGMSLSQNRISGSTVGIEFHCIGPTNLKSNLLNDVGTGFADVPFGFSLNFNRFWNLDQIKTSCAAGGTRR